MVKTKVSSQSDFFPDVNPKNKPERPSDYDDYDDEEEKCPVCFELLSKHGYNQIVTCALNEIRRGEKN